MSEKIAAIRIRGKQNLKQGIKDTLKMLNLFKKNYCVVYNKSPDILGMLKKAKDYITYGEIDEGTLKKLKEEKGEGKRFFRLQPPKGGFERKGIKTGFTSGGVLGYRGKKINDLIKRMI